MNTNSNSVSENSDKPFLEFIDLGEALKYGIEPPKQLIDGLLYEEGIHSVYSPGGTGKTILALWVAIQTIKQGLKVIYVDEENGSHHISDLLKCMGADPELVSKHFKYAPAPGLTIADAERWKSSVESICPALVAFDSFADHLALDGLSENTSTDVTSWIKAFAQPVKDIGGAVLILDHVSKESSGKGARGSTAKLAKVDVAWKLELNKPFDRSTIGNITIKRDKDRKGAMPYVQCFAVGGDGFSNLHFSPEGVSDEPKPKTLKGNPKKAYDTLFKDFPKGARATEWQVASGIAETTFYNAIKELQLEYAFKDEDTSLYHALPLLPNDSHGSSESKTKDTPTNSHTLKGGSNGSNGGGWELPF